MQRPRPESGRRHLFDDDSAPPDELIDRPKQGFGVPVYEWFFDRLGAEARTELDAFCGQTDFLDRDEVMRYVDTKQGPEVWYLLNFALWWKEFVAT